MSIKSFSSFNEEAKGDKWIQDAIKNPGALKKSMGKGEGEKISKSEINAELSKLKSKDKDPDKKGVQGLSKKDLTKFKRLNLAKTLKGLKEHQEHSNYMFFANLETIQRLVDEMLHMDKSKLDSILSDGHGWAVDHISTSKDDIEEVFNFLASHDEPTQYDSMNQPIETNEEPIENEMDQESSSRIKGFGDFQ